MATNAANAQLYLDNLEQDKKILKSPQKSFILRSIERKEVSNKTNNRLRLDPNDLHSPTHSLDPEDLYLYNKEKNRVKTACSKKSL